MYALLGAFKQRIIIINDKNERKQWHLTLKDLL